MFERFTGNARRVVVLAQEKAREHGSDVVRTEHVLAAVVAVPGTLATAVLTAFGTGRSDVEADLYRLHGRGPAPSDAAALATLATSTRSGVRSRRRSAPERWTAPARPGAAPVPRGHIPLDRTTKKALELALREAVRMSHGYIGSEHILLGLLHAEGGAHDVLVERGIRLEPARVVVEELVRGRAAS